MDLKGSLKALVVVTFLAGCTAEPHEDPVDVVGGAATKEQAVVQFFDGVDRQDSRLLDSATEPTLNATRHPRKFSFVKRPGPIRVEGLRWWSFTPTMMVAEVHGIDGGGQRFVTEVSLREIEPEHWFVQHEQKATGENMTGSPTPIESR